MEKTELNLLLEKLQSDIEYEAKQPMPKKDFLDKIFPARHDRKIDKDKNLFQGDLYKILDCAKENLSEIDNIDEVSRRYVSDFLNKTQENVNKYDRSYTQNYNKQGYNFEVKDNMSNILVDKVKEAQNFVNSSWKERELIVNNFLKPFAENVEAVFSSPPSSHRDKKMVKVHDYAISSIYQNENISDGMKDYCKAIIDDSKDIYNGFSGGSIGNTNNTIVHNIMLLNEVSKFGVHEVYSINHIKPQKIKTKFDDLDKNLFDGVIKDFKSGEMKTEKTFDDKEIKSLNLKAPNEVNIEVSSSQMDLSKRIK